MRLFDRKYHWNDLREYGTEHITADTWWYNNSMTNQIRMCVHLYGTECEYAVRDIHAVIWL